MNSNTKLIGLILATVLCTSSHGGDSEVSGTLFWGNGDSLDGRLHSINGDTLIWNSPLFAEPLSLKLGVLSAVRVPELEAAEPVKAADDGFCITLLNNNVLYGKIASVKRDSITFDSRRHGTFKVRRDQIRSLQRNQNKGLVFLGPRGLDGWTQKSATSGVSNWREQDDGSLTTIKGGASITKKLKWPKRCEVEFVLTSSSIPDFIMTFGGGGKPTLPRLEMWDDSFVARTDNVFIELLSVPQDLRKLHVFVFIDFEEKSLVAYSHTGRKLGEMKGKGASKVGSTLTLEAVDSDLTLKHLRVCEWDGTIPKSLAEGESHVFMNDGQVHYGSLSGFSDKSQTVRIQLAEGSGDTKKEAEKQDDGTTLKSDDKPTDDKPTDDKPTDDKPADDEPADDEPADDEPADDEPADDEPTDDEPTGPEFVEVNVADIRRVAMSVVEQNVNDAGKTIVAWRNGGFLSGVLNSMDEQSITMTPDYCDGPIRSSLAGVRRIGLPNTDVAEEQPDKLFFDGGSLRGNLTVEDNEEPIRWTPIGGRNATTLVSGGNARFQRGVEPEQLAIDSLLFPDVIYLHDGDVFPCRVKQCDEKQIQIVSPITELPQLDVSLVKAIEFGNSERSRHKGFNQDDWTRITGSVKYGKSNVGFNGNAAFGHTGAMIGDCLSFRIKWRSNCFGSITFHLFAEDLKNPDTATTVNLQLLPSQIAVSDKAPNQNGRQMFFGFNPGRQQDNSTVRVKDRDALVEMVAKDGKVHVSINGTKSTVIDLNSEGAGAKGLVIKSTITNVSRSSRNAPTVPEKLGSLAEIDDFLVRNVVGASVKQFIQEEARDLALTVPRFRRDDPPTHVLLAPNGDLLRGRLAAVTNTEIVFESRLETFRFPRERVAAVIWLSLDKDAPPTPVREPSAVQARLDNGFMLTMTPDRMSGGQLIGQSKQLGTCRVPASAIRDLFLGSPESREATLSYVQWIRRDAREPEWETDEDGSESPASSMVGQVVEDFELPTLNGDTFRLSDHKEKVVVLDFWATWCGPCVAALPEYVEATSNFEPSDAIFVAVNLEESPERIKEFLSRNDLSPTVAMDRGSVIAKRFQVSGIPHSVVLGPGGVIKHVTVGYKPGVGARTQEHIQELLSGESKI